MKDRGITQARTGPRSTAGATVQPWIGPDSYCERQQALFKGRDEERDDILRLLLRDTLTVLFGASGLGKTSLLQAGLFPELRKREMLPVYLRLDHDEAAPALSQQVLDAARLAAATGQARVQSPSFDVNQSLWQNFHREDALFWSVHHKIITPVIVLDQFEEIFTRGQRNRRCVERSEVFLNELSDLVENHVPSGLVSGLDAEGRDAIDAGYVLGGVPLKIIISLREDYLAPLEQLRQRMPLLGTNRMRLTHLSVSQAHEVVEAPAAPYDLLAEGVADQIVRYVSASDRSVTKRDGAGAMARVARISSDFEPEVDPALLSIFCYELNAQRQHAGMRQITLELLNASKDQILLSFYERAFEGVAKQVRRFVEDRLVSPQGYRDSRTLDDALSTTGVTQEALDLLVARRLLCYEEQGSGPKRVELKHDVFLRIAEARRTARALVERRRERLRNVLRRASVFGAPVLLLALLIAGLGYRYLYTWEHEVYYAAFVKVRGEPRGVGPITATERAHRPFSLRMIRRGRWGHVVRMEAVDAQGRLTADHGIGTFMQYYDGGRPRRHMEARWEFVYDRSGQVVAELAYDRGIRGDGSVAAESKPRLVWQFLYSPVVQQEGSTERIGHFLGERGVPLGFMRAFVRLEYDRATGFEKRVRYFDDFNRPLPGRDRAFGQALDYDDAGRLLRTTSLDANGRPMMDEIGNASVELLSNERGEVVQSTLLDLSGKPTLGLQGYMRLKTERDRWGNPISDAVFMEDEAGEWQKVRSSKGFHRQTFSRDAHGLITGWRFWDEFERPTYDEDGCYGLDLKLDEEGNRTQDTCVDDAGKPVINARGWALLRRTFDAGGDILSEAAFDEIGRPVDSGGDATFAAGASRAHRIRFERNDEGQETAREYYWANGSKAHKDGSWRTESHYDEHGNLSSRRHLDENKRLTLTKLGYASADYTWDAAGRLQRISFRDVTGQPVLGSEGYASSVQEHDERGYVRLVTYVGPDNMEVIQDGGYSRIQYSERDSLGNPTKTTFLGADGKPVVTATGVTGYESDFDEHGIEVKRCYVGAHGEKVMHSSGFSCWRRLPDRLGRISRLEILGRDGAPITGREGSAGWTTRFDAWGNELEHTTIDATGAPTVSASGYAHTLNKFDRQHNTIQTEYRDTSNHLTSKSDQCARRTFAFDEFRNLLAEECYDSAEKPRLNDDGAFRTVRQYNERGLESSKRFFGVLSQPVLSKELGCHGVELSYDVNGNIRRSAYLGLDGRPIAAVDGVAVQHREYVGYNRLSLEYGLDTEEKKVRFREGFYRELREYDSSGRLTRRRYLGENNEPVVHENGYAEVQYVYRVASNNRAPSIRNGDSEGEDELRYIGLNGELVRSRFGYARRESTYASDGLLQSQTYFDEAGMLSVSWDGYARVEKEYRREPGGRVVEARLFSPEGRPVLGRRDGARFATMRVSLNDFGQMTEVSYEGPTGQPAPQAHGCSKLKLAYDSRGNLVQRGCYVGDRPALLNEAVDAYHAMRAQYNSQGNLLFWETLGADGKLMINGSHFARQDSSYDSAGRLVSVWNTDCEQQRIESTLGWARRDLRYDDNGNVVEETYYGADNKLKAIGGVARRTATFDESGHLLSASRFDASNEHLSTVYHEYDRRGLLHTQRAERNGKAIFIPGTTWIKSEFRYDTLGRPKTQLNYGANGKPSSSCPAVDFNYDVDGTSTQTCAPLRADASSAQ